MNARLVRIAAVATVVLVSIAVIVLSRMHTRAAPIDARAAAPSVATARAKFGPFVVRVIATGRVGAPAGSQARLSFAGSGIVQSIAVGVGERVARSQALAQLDTSALAIDAATARPDAAAAAAAFRAQRSGVRKRVSPRHVRDYSRRKAKPEAPTATLQRRKPRCASLKKNWRPIDAHWIARNKSTLPASARAKTSKLRSRSCFSIGPTGGKPKQGS